MRIVLLGYLGSGKTTLYDRITNANVNVKLGGESVTVNVFQKDSAFGSSPFTVLDTPGLGVSC